MSWGSPFPGCGWRWRGAVLGFQLLCSPRLACLLPKARWCFRGAPLCLCRDVLHVCLCFTRGRADLQTWGHVGW